MSDRSHEKISVLMDGEMDSNAIRFLIKRMISDPSLGQTWNRYHLIRGCLQKSPDEPLMVNVADQVLARLGVREYGQPEPSSRAHRWLKPVAGMGIAASVALTAVLLLQQSPVTENTRTRSEQFLVKQKLPSQSVPLQTPAVQFVDLPRAQLATSVSEWRSSGYPDLKTPQYRGFLYQEAQQRAPGTLQHQAPYVYLVAPETRSAGAQSH